MLRSHLPYASTQGQSLPYHSYDSPSQSTCTAWQQVDSLHSGLSHGHWQEQDSRSAYPEYPQYPRSNYAALPLRGVVAPQSPPVSPHTVTASSLPAMSANGAAPILKSSQDDYIPYRSGDYSAMGNGGYSRSTYPASSHPGSRTASRPVSPYPPHAPHPAPEQVDVNEVSQAGNLPKSIVSYLQLPESISSSKGSLAEFASQITCLFWFESSQTLTNIEDSRVSAAPTAMLTPDAIPSTGFLKWVTTILSTTQVTQNVILLALLFIHRLKKQNPTVKGKPGSEYRLLTVALMLGNKFLDDNTYTNKTWAEVSGISVHEIHVMEVEFLSHMKYNLYTSYEEWFHWHQQLGKFWSYFNRASRALEESRSRLPSMRPTLEIPYALPSPPASTSTSPPFRTSPSPSSALYPSLPQLGPLSASPAVSIPDVDVSTNGRKRSYDYILDEPPAKRQHNYSPLHTPATGRAYTSSRSNSTVAMSLPPMPKLPMPSSQASSLYTPTSTMTPTNLQHTPHAVLPPINWVQAVNPQNTMAGHSTHAITRQQAGDRSNYQPSYGSLSRQPSPTTSNYPSTLAHTTNHSQLSPSYFLTQRDSPYRPVRNIRTLLVPPPSGSLQNPTTGVSNDQMGWQPLGKQSNSVRRGPLPYLHRDAWPNTHQIEQWPPMYPVQPTV